MLGTPPSCRENIKFECFLRPLKCHELSLTVGLAPAAVRFTTATSSPSSS